MSLYDSSWAIRIGVHFGLFQNGIESSGTEEQIKYFIPLIQSMKIIGSFSMTELGHGSYVRGVETTSTYDKNSQEFIINSPTETSTKWWIGMAGQTATHTIVFAKLVIDGREYGTHSFIVQIRSTETGLPLPGISVGDVGPKMGNNGIDNGWIKFDNVRIPRDLMLMRWAKVSPEGIFSEPQRPQLSYGALLVGRILMIRDAAKNVEKALTIAIRYSAIRRQFPSSDQSVEEQILNYQTHQYRLIPMLANAYAFHFASIHMSKQHQSLIEAIDQDNLENLNVVHATSAGLKAFSTWWCNESLEIARQCLGGHGYSSYSGLPHNLQDWAVNCTWEGDNTVLAQQTTRFLLSSYKKKLKGKGPLTGFVKYFEDCDLNSKCTVRNMNDLLDHSVQFKILSWLSTYLVNFCATRIKEEKSKGLSSDEATNNVRVDLVITAQAHSYLYILYCFMNVIEEIPGGEERKILSKLCSLFALHRIEQFLRYFLEGEYMCGKQSRLISLQVRQLCAEIREVAVPLVDSFNFPDFVLRSPLGRKDGNIYKAYIEKVKSAPENQTQITPYHEILIKPLTNSSL